MNIAPIADASTTEMVEEARALMPAFAVADTPDGVALSRSGDSPDVDTEVWLPDVGTEDDKATIGDLFDKYGNDKVLLYLEPEPWDLGEGEPLPPEDPRGGDPKDPYVPPTNQAVTASLPWSDSPVAQFVVGLADQALAVLEEHVSALEQAAEIVPSGIVAALPPPPVDDDTDLADKVFGEAPDLPMNVLFAAAHGNPQAQQRMIDSWSAAYQPGMGQAQMIEAVMPPRPTAPRVDVETWDAVAHEIGLWVRNQEGEPANPDAPDDIDLSAFEAAPEVEDVPFDPPVAVTAATPGMSRSYPRSGSSWLTEREHQQRVEAGRRSAERRRKAEVLRAAKKAARRRARDQSVSQTDFQRGMAILNRNGVRGADLTDTNGSLAGKSSEAHERLLNSVAEAGYSISTFEDGSGSARRGNHVLKFGAPPDDGGGHFSGDGVLVRPGDPRWGNHGNLRPSSSTASKKKKTSRMPSAWGGHRGRR